LTYLKYKQKHISGDIPATNSYELTNFDKELSEIDETILLIKQINIDF